MTNEANENLGAKHYRERMFGDEGRCECNNQTVCKKGKDCYYKKAKAALDRAHDIRKFEIELLWKRAAYVATFQTLLFAALGLSFRAQYNDLVPLFQIVTCIAGVFSSFFWRLINKGSKFWHENWTYHIDFLEDEFEGKLHKTVLYSGNYSRFSHAMNRVERVFSSNKKFLGAKTQPYSVSRVNISISNMFCAAWLFLLLVFLWNFFKPFCDTIFSAFSVKGWVILLCVIIVLCLFALWRNFKLKSEFDDTSPEKDVRWAKRELPNMIGEPSRVSGKMISFLIRLLCLIIPVSAWRKAIRSKFVGPISRPKRMKRFNKIADWRLDDVDGVKVATGVLRGGKTIRLAHVFGKDITPAYGAHEIFNDNEYHFSAQGEAVVIDIGMNYGFASLYFALRDDVEAVYAFEPAKPVYEKALFSFSLNECADKITAYNCGLGDSDKAITLNFNPTGTGATSTIPEHPSAGKTKLPAQIKDAAAEIRGIIARHPGKRVVVKCDCEGGEKEIFARLDAKNVLSRIDCVMMEYHHNYDEFIEPLLDKHGFVYFKSSPHASVGIIRAVKQNGNH